MKAALASGFRKFDTASIYGNEEEIGEAIRESDVPREEIFVTTKLYPNQFANAEAAIEECLEKLNIGYIDLMLLHHPARTMWRHTRRWSGPWRKVRSVLWAFRTIMWRK